MTGGLIPRPSTSAGSWRAPAPKPVGFPGSRAAESAADARQGESPRHAASRPTEPAPSIANGPTVGYLATDLVRNRSASTTPLEDVPNSMACPQRTSRSAGRTRTDRPLLKRDHGSVPCAAAQGEPSHADARRQRNKPTPYLPVEIASCLGAASETCPSYEGREPDAKATAFESRSGEYAAPTFGAQL